VHLDTTIKLSDIFLIGGGVVSFLVMYARFITAIDKQTAFNQIVMSILKDEDTGLVPQMRDVKKEVLKHRDRIIRLEVESAIPQQDRS